jgi:SNF2 family DNA or RNA helicase
MSQNSELLIAATRKELYNLMLSATAAKDPTEMRAIGYALGLHNLTKDTLTQMSWFRWMKRYGCRMDQFRNWVAGPLKYLAELNNVLYPEYAVSLRPSDLPSAFMENHVITEPLTFMNTKDIVDAYSSVMSETLIDLVSGDRQPEPSILTEILRARQVVEACKVPETCLLVEQALDEGYSTVVFVSFTDTINMFLRVFPDAAVVRGGQSDAERESNIQAFQNNEKRVLICNSAAGGTGVSLHDIHGDHPRMTFINPSYNLIEYVQTLGRVHRNGAKSHAVQRVLVAADTIEEEIISAIERKRLQSDTLHATNLPDTNSES